MGFDFGNFGLPETGPAQVFTQVGLVMAIIFSLIVAVLLVGIFIVGFILKKTRHAAPFTTRDLTYGAVCLAVSFAISFIGVSMPQGGTVTFASILPVVLYCYYFGFRKGFVICVIYTMLQFLQKPYIVHFMSAILDYVIPYLSLSIVGLFSYKHRRMENAETKGAMLKAHLPIFFGIGLYALVRYISHFLSGIVFYAEYAYTNWAVWAYSLVYNSFCLIDAAIAAIAATALLSSKTFNTFMASTAHTLKYADAAHKND